MALELHVAGPGVDVVRRMEHGEPAVIIGRDSDCTICLPDPERSISRRHLSVWNEGGQLHFHVLSVVNGVHTIGGELPPGARGVLPQGDFIALSTFRVEAVAVPVPRPDEDLDTWGRLQMEAERLGPAGDPTIPPMEEDPFSADWGFSSTFGAGPNIPAEGLVPAMDLQPFLAGLGFDPSVQAAFTQHEMETIGRITRVALEGLVQASQAAATSRREVRADDHTRAEKREMNPLRMDSSMEVKLFYLFGGAATSAGFLPPDRAVAQLAQDLVAHEQAVAQAVQDTVRGLLDEFAPEALKQRLLGSGGRLFGSARAWDAFVRDYAERSGQEEEWVRQLLGRHFSRSYNRALLRAKRNTTDGTGG